MSDSHDDVLDAVWRVLGLKEAVTTAPLARSTTALDVARHVL